MPSLCVLLAALGCLLPGCASGPGRAPPHPKDPSDLAAEFLGGDGNAGNQAPGLGPDDPVTHLGRGVLARSDSVVLGRVTSLEEPVRGVEIARIDVLDVYRGRAGDRRMAVLCGEPGKLPRPGQAGLFFVAAGTGGPTRTLLDVAPLPKGRKDPRLDAFVTYVEIESEPTLAARLDALLGYLRGALASGHTWTRDNAAREYAALARTAPDVLERADADVLFRARSRARDPAVRSLLDQALGSVRARPVRRTGPAGSEGPTSRPETPEPEPTKDPTIDRVVARVSDPALPPKTRRKAVVDAAAEFGARAAPVFEKALSDEDPGVREAGVVAAGATQARDLAPKLVSMLSTEAAAGVLRSLIRSLGRLGVPEAVAGLAPLAVEGARFSREACFALARIRSPEALDRLRALHRESRDPDRRDLLEYLTSEAFPEQERRLRGV